MFFSKFCIQNATLQNGNILGCNNRTQKVDTMIKSVYDGFLKNQIFKDHSNILPVQKVLKISFVGLITANIAIFQVVNLPTNEILCVFWTGRIF